MANQKSKTTMHPNYNKLTVVMADGVTTFETRSTLNNEVLRLDTDPTTHPAWTKAANYVNTKASEVAKFNQKFGDLFANKKS